MKKSIFLITLVALISSCAPKISTTIFKHHEPLDSRADILVFGIKDDQPENSEKLGVIKAASDKCHLPFVLAGAVAESRKIGGNALKITQYTTNKEGCPIITANILRVDNPQDYQFSTISDTANYVLVHIYRPHGFGAAFNYDLHLTNYDLGIEDTIIARSKNNWRETIKFEESGYYTLWADSIEPARAPLSIKLGNEYYVRSSVFSGTLAYHPELRLMDNISGRIEIQTVGDVSKLRNYSRFRFAVSAGLGCRIAPVSKDFVLQDKDILQQLRSGFQYDLGITYFFSKWGGIGFKYNEFRSSAEGQRETFSNNVLILRKKINIDAQTNYIGPTVCYRFFDNRNTFFIDFGLGYMKHQEKHRESYSRESLRSTINGSTLGFYTSFGYDIRLIKATSLGFQLAIVGGLKEVAETVQWHKHSIIHLNEHPKKLGRIDLSIGLRF